VPAEAREHHAHVDPRRGDAADELPLLPADGQHGVLGVVDVVEVVWIFSVVEVMVLGTGGGSEGKTATVSISWQVSSVFNSYFVFLWRLNFSLLVHSLHQSPVLVLKPGSPALSLFVELHPVPALEVNR
jgi:hypothetical protein